MAQEGVFVPGSSKILKVNQNLSFLSADDYSLTEKDLEKALKELNETEEKKNNCLRELKDKLSSENVNYRMDDEYLLRFLRARKFDIEKAFKTIKDFYAVRRKHPDVFELPSNLESLMNLGFYTRLPYVDEEGRILCKVDYGILNLSFKKYITATKWNPSEVSFFEILTLMIVVSDIVTMNPKSQINGIIGIWDMKQLSSSHLAQFIYPRRVLLFLKILQGCYPWRIKAIIGVNCGKLSQMFYKVFKPFVKKKIIERVLLLGSDMTELHQHVNPAILPKQFGGKLEDSECSITQQVLDNLPYLKYERSFGEENDREK